MKQYKQTLPGAKVLCGDNPTTSFLSKLYDLLFVLTADLGRYPYWSEVIGCHVIDPRWAGVIDAGLNELCDQQLVKEVTQDVQT